MCGIAGIFNFRSNKPVTSSEVERMTEAMSHRGPDAEGLYIDGNFGLGHRRLSILDLSERGQQPMGSPDGRCIISYNGEVYNYLELRSELQSKGIQF